jgi:very-short-patch-repair endonuclease
MLKLQLETVPAYSLAMERSGISLLRQLVLTNDGAEPLDDLRLEIGLQPDLGEPIMVKLPTMHGGEILSESDRAVPLPVGLMQQVSEDRTIEIRVRVLCGDQALIQQSRTLQLLAYNTLRWVSAAGGDAAEAYACFVTPNHPVIAQVLKETSRTLESLGCNNSLEGYQSANPKRVVEMVSALYQTLGRLGISYINPPAGFWSAGQRIRLPDQVLGEGLGTCADLTPLAAACLEQIGLDPVLVCLHEHVLPGVFLTEDAAKLRGAVLEDVSTVRQLIDAHDLLLFDSSTYVATPQPPFTDAVATASAYLDEFVYLVNIYQARRNGYPPLSIRMSVREDQPGEVLSLARQILQQAALRPSPDPSTYSQAPRTGDSESLDATVRRRFRTWQDRLLDLSTRNNRLLHLGNLDFTGSLLSAWKELFTDLLQSLAKKAGFSEADLENLQTSRQNDSSITLPNEFSFSTPLDIAPFIEQLRYLFPDSLRESFDCYVHTEQRRIFQQIVQKLQRTLSSRRSLFLILDTPEDLLPQMVELLAAGKELTLLGDQGSGTGDEAVARTAMELSRNRCRTAYSLGLDMPMSSEQLMKTGRTLSRDARLAEEESGFSPLYLAAGLLQWLDKSGTPRLAPLLLYPVELKVDNRNQKITLIRSQGEHLGNITLLERLRQDFDLSLDTLADLPENDEGIDLEALLCGVQHAIIGRPGWRVIPASLITTFSFATFLLWRDLQDNRDQMLRSETVRHIATAGRDPFPDPIPDLRLEDLDDLSSADLPLVVEADSSQIAAVHAALRGRSFVLQGPPGTGKSQTITNIIAAAMAHGKTVLFVAQKAAAVEVVHNRLRAVGLDDFCLDLHKPDSNPEQVLASFLQAIAAQEAAPEFWDSQCRELDQLRHNLRTFTRALHQPRAIGFSLFQMLAAIDDPGFLPPLPQQLRLERLTEERFQTQLEEIRAFARDHALHVVQQDTLWGDLPDLPWSMGFDQQLRVLLPQARLRLQELGEQMAVCRVEGLSLQIASWEALMQVVLTIRRFSGREIPSYVFDPQRWEPLRQSAQSFLQNKEQLDSSDTSLRAHWQPAAFKRDLNPLIQRMQKHFTSFVMLRWIKAFFLKRELNGLHRERLPALRQVLQDLREIRDLPGLEERQEQDRQDLIEQLPAWNGECAALPDLLKEWDGLAHMARSNPESRALMEQVAALAPATCAGVLDRHARMEEAFAELAEALTLSALPLPKQRQEPLESLSGWLNSLLENLSELRSWSLSRALENKFRATEAGPLLDWARQSSLPLEQLEEAYHRSVLRSWFQRIFDAEPCLRTFNGSSHTNIVKRFRELDAHVQQLSRRYVRASVIGRMPNRQLSLTGSEMSELNRESVKKKRRLPLRALFSRIPNLLPKLKPCLLASPISVSRYLPAGGQRFDIIIFDEASQVETHHAIGAIGRGEQVVIVGDNKQMPPSSFFQRSALPDDGVATFDGVEDLESILDEAIACGLPQQMLQWHYRSRHESLIAFSNQRYYSSSLNIFPAPSRLDPQLGLHWHPIPQGYYKPGARINDAEARALVSFLIERLRAHTPGQRSFGVITFSMPQQQLIESLLQKACEEDPELEAWFARDSLDYCFVKNLETVQGDERDEILFSICFGPRKDGSLSMSFGTLNQAGGERRLNVAITRARCALHLFSTLQPEQIDRNRTNSMAVHQLQDYLLFCRNQQRLAERPLRTADFDSDLQRQIHELLSREGYSVDCKVGCASYRIDLAVVDPEKPCRYLIGIECDGETYASAATVRDRDRLRTAVLEQLGWTLHRVWSLEWHLSPEQEKLRLLEAVRRAFETPLPIAEPPPVASPDPAASAVATAIESSGPIKRTQAPAPETAPEVPAAAPLLGQPYRVARLEPVSTDFQSFYLPQSIPKIADRLLTLLADEAPILTREATVRVTQCWNGKAISTKAQDSLMVIARSLHHQNRLFLDGEDTLWKSGAQCNDWQGFRLPPDSGRSIDTVPMAERRGALLLITQQALSIQAEALLREACLQLTGGSRFTQPQRQGILPAFEQLLRQGHLQQREERIFATTTNIGH